EQQRGRRERVAGEPLRSAARAPGRRRGREGVLVDRHRQRSAPACCRIRVLSSAAASSAAFGLIWLLSAFWTAICTTVETLSKPGTFGHSLPFSMVVRRSESHCFSMPCASAITLSAVDMRLG